MDVAIFLDNGLAYRRSILDKTHGRRDVWVKKSGLSAGSYVRYSSTKRQGNNWITDCTIEDMPFTVAQVDLLFFHHVLEICYYFLPVGTGESCIFELVSILYVLPEEQYSSHFKKLFLCKLLGLIGMYPQVSQDIDGYVAQVQTYSLDMLCTVSLDLESKKKINQWLWASVMQHPASSLFRTAHFLLT